VVFVAVARQIATRIPARNRRSFTPEFPHADHQLDPITLKAGSAKPGRTPLNSGLTGPDPSLSKPEFTAKPLLYG
jgi:hypothetical protein